MDFFVRDLRTSCCLWWYGCITYSNRC